jgi:pimeloyl-ACP methyl ester carboxylesterase
LAQKRELTLEDFGAVAYYTNAQAALGQRPLLLLHGMHLRAGAHDFTHLFDAFRAQRHVYAADLPGFGASDVARGEAEYEPALYMAAIKQLIELCASDALAPVDVVAVGLTCEYAARAVASLPDMVNTLTMIEPTGFASQRQESVLERIARSGSTFIPVAVLERLGLGRLCSGGFASVLSGAAFPKEDPQAAYTRVHCPTLVLHARERRARYGTLARFVRWREHYQESELLSANLGDRGAAAGIEAAMTRFFGERANPDALPKLRAG